MNVMDEKEALNGQFSAALRRHFDKVGVERARRVLNILLESPFFYRDDDVDLFDVLRRNTPAFRSFFEESFGWTLEVDRYLARLVKPAVFNPALAPSQRTVFQIAGRDECLLFMLLLEFQESESERQNVGPDDGELRFVAAHFVDFVFRRYRELLGDSAPSEERILVTARELFAKLERFRFVAERERGDSSTARAERFSRDGARNLLYAFLPGMRCYRTEALADAIIKQAHGTGAAGAEPGGEEPTTDA